MVQGYKDEVKTYTVNLHNAIFVLVKVFFKLVRIKNVNNLVDLFVFRKNGTSFYYSLLWKIFYILFYIRYTS